jgi:2-C-methyl-D-erythritol 4-phosphate cytidylyltransferase
VAVHPKTVAVVAAGGAGSRVGGEVPKQFVAILGRPLLAHTLVPFYRCAEIDAVVLVLPREGFESFRELMSPWTSHAKLLAVVPGGPERQDSVWEGFRAIPAGTDLVAVHDGARPCIDPDLIRRTLTSAEQHGAALSALATHETLKEVGPGGIVVGTVDRRTIYRAQTPQGFRYAILRRAFEQARADGFRGTDESALVERLGVHVHIVLGSATNVKVTTAEDLKQAAELLLRAGNS